MEGIDVRYDRLVPGDMDLTFREVWDHCRNGNYRGVNVTYPYKEQVLAYVDTMDDETTRLGAINTVLFKGESVEGYNTDYLGFIAAYHTIMGSVAPGMVGVIGSGGVGRAVAFALQKLGARRIKLFDLDPDKTSALCRDLASSDGAAVAVQCADIHEVVHGCNGIINCSPVGMDGRGGSPVPSALMQGMQWAFDAIYTPRDTVFLRDAAINGLTIISGFELFFYQGVYAWNLFSGRCIDQDQLRRRLEAEQVSGE